jgi:hypothetical protein
MLPADMLATPMLRAAWVVKPLQGEGWEERGKLRY